MNWHNILYDLAAAAAIGIIGAAAYIHLLRRDIRNRYEHRVTFRECPWCGKKLRTGVALLAHIDNLHNKG